MVVPDLNPAERRAGMLLVVDIGNTNTVLGVFDGDELVASWRVQTHHGRTADEHGILVRQLFDYGKVSAEHVSGAIISCVVPPMEPVFVEMIRDYFDAEPYVVGKSVTEIMPVLYEKPSDVGADRVVNAIGAWERRTEDRPLVIVDFGTATTFDAISERGEYLGGAICPGITISSEALYRFASKLPRVELAKPERVIGRNTVESIQSGLLHGYTGLVREIVTRMKEELGENTRVLATGGLARFLVTETGIVDEVDELLTLHGLRIIHERMAT
jgi:type III pantothenate kinase